MESLGQCLSYKKGKINLTVCLPEKKPYCQYCIIGLSYNQAFDRYVCRLTGELILDPKHSIGDGCPVEWEDDDESV